MIEVLTTNDPIRLNFAETVLKDAGIETVTLDANTAAVFGGALPWVKRRLLVPEADGSRARRVLAEAMPKDDPETGPGTGA
ncbi:MAG: DUF2007 domain-containing protein [Oceanicaulis sp.]